MEGLMAKTTLFFQVLLAKGNVPAENFTFFIDILLCTIRDEIASCLEKAYTTISCNEASRMLNLREAELAEYGRGRGWVVQGGKFVYRGADMDQEVVRVPSYELANLAIGYAREMEQIV